MGLDGCFGSIFGGIGGFSVSFCVGTGRPDFLKKGELVQFFSIIENENHGFSAEFAAG